MNEFADPLLDLRCRQNTGRRQPIGSTPDNLATARSAFPAMVLQQLHLTARYKRPPEQIPFVSHTGVIVDPPLVHQRCDSLSQTAGGCLCRLRRLSNHLQQPAPRRYLGRQNEHHTLESLSHSHVCDS